MPRSWVAGWVMTLVALLAAGCGGGGHKVTEPSPLVTTSGVTAGGAGVLGAYPTRLTANYTPNGNFGLAFLIRNRSDEPVTIVGLSSTDESEKRFARLVGASAAAYVPIDCDGHSCPATDLGLGSPPYEALPPLTPLTIPAHKQASIQLHFRWVPCLDAPTQAGDKENTVLVVNYRTGGKAGESALADGAGTTRRQRRERLHVGSILLTPRIAEASRLGQRSGMSPEEAGHEATPPRGRVDATGHPRADTEAMPKPLDLRFSRTDDATPFIHRGWVRFGIGHLGRA